MAVTFDMLRVNDLIWSFVINNYLQGKGRLKAIEDAPGSYVRIKAV